MIKITKFDGGEKRRPDWPWWTLVEAVIWIVGEEDFEGPPVPAAGASREEINAFIAPTDGDLDWSAREWAAKELHTALAQGRVIAYGLRSHSDKAERIEPVDWNASQVPISEFRGLNSWQYEPYSSVVVAKEEIRRCWPVQLASDDGSPRRRGRPEEYDWPQILQFAAEERRNSPSGRKLEMIIQARCHDELGYLQGQPSAEAIRYQLKKARNKSP